MVPTDFRAQLPENYARLRPPLQSSEWTWSIATASQTTSQSRIYVVFKRFTVSLDAEAEQRCGERALDQSSMHKRYKISSHDAMLMSVVPSSIQRFFPLLSNSTTMLLILLIPVLVVSFILYRFCYFQFLHPLSKFPGPFWAKQTDFWRVYQLWTTRLPNTLLELHRKYGSVVRVGPNELSFQDLDSIAPIYKSGRKVMKSDFYSGFTTFHPNLFGTRDEEVRTVCVTSSCSQADCSSYTQPGGDKWLMTSPWTPSRRWSRPLIATLETYSKPLIHLEANHSISKNW